MLDVTWHGFFNFLYCVIKVKVDSGKLNNFQASSLGKIELHLHMRWTMRFCHETVFFSLASTTQCLGYKNNLNMFE